MLRNIDIGKNAEDIAVQFLKKNKYKIIEKNYRKTFGEIDIIAYDGEVLCFVEVKSRKNSDYGHPLEFIDGRKRGKIIKTALAYINEKRMDEIDFRFDTVSVITGEKYSVELIKGAFDVSY